MALLLGTGPLMVSEVKMTTQANTQRNAMKSSFKVTLKLDLKNVWVAVIDLSCIKI